MHITILCRKFSGMNKHKRSITNLTLRSSRLFFPPVVETTSESSPADKPTVEEATPQDKGQEEEEGAKQDKEETKKDEEEAKLDAEAEAIAKELPSPPTADPSATGDGHVGKKQKVSDDDV